ncbi:hypothetical protein VRK_29480 [Vibrio sp. MEBiC08052]|nr:hypothetical protein VRK_29480 [Vibrio sp. MEBiC08052]
MGLVPFRGETTSSILLGVHMFATTHYCRYHEEGDESLL